MTVEKYIVTGGAGFIGANFIKYLLAKYGSDVDITIVDALTYAGNLKSIADEINRPNVNFVKADICDANTIGKLIESVNPDFVVNFAAESHVDRSIENPGLFLQTNILGTQTLLDACRETWKNSDGSWAGGKRFLQVSTDEVYGSLNRDCPKGREFEIPEPLCKAAGGRPTATAYGSEFFTEASPLQPRSPYSTSKAAADMLTQAYNHTYGLPTLVTRCSNNYGPYQFPEKLIPLVINNVLTNRKIPVYGDGANVRDWLYVQDHCCAIDIVLHRGTPGQAYNIGGFNEQRNIDIVKLIISEIRKLALADPKYAAMLADPNSLPDESLISFVTDRAGHDGRYAIDPLKTATELGWAPRISFAEGLPRTVRWYLDNRPWIDEIVQGEYQQYYQQMYKNPADNP